MEDFGLLQVTAPMIFGVFLTLFWARWGDRHESILSEATILFILFIISHYVITEDEFQFLLLLFASIMGVAIGTAWLCRECWMKTRYDEQILKHLRKYRAH